MSNIVEFWEMGGGLVTSVESAPVPIVGSIVNIRKTDYTVQRVNFSVDYSDEVLSRRKLRCNVFVIKSKGDQ